MDERTTDGMLQPRLFVTGQTCEYCGKSIATPKRIRPEQRFCNRACRFASMRRSQPQQCVVCDKTFRRIPAKQGPYCSRTCMGIAQRKPLSDAFWSKVDKGDGQGCWLWMGGAAHFGHGLFTMGNGGHTLGAHRFAFEETYGPIPEGMAVCHRCDNPPCVRPDHLFLGSLSDNMADRNRKGRQARGETSGMAKLTDDDVRAIRAVSGVRGAIKALAAQYDIGERAIWQIRARRTWRHI